MNLNDLSGQYVAAAGKDVGFIIKSLRNPGRKFKVEAKLGTGKYAITRLDSGESFLVGGTEDRYEMAFSLARISEVKCEIAELEEQKAIIAARLVELSNEFGGVLSVG